MMIGLAVAALVAGGTIMLVRQAAAERAAALRATAKKLGWAFREAVPFGTIPDLDRFELFRPGHSKKLTNLLTSPAGDPRGVLFEYSYTIAGGKSQQVHRQTVFYAVGDELRLPSFSLRPENFFHRIGGAFGYQDIDLERMPTFSSMFLLRGEDEAGVRAAFTDVVAEFFERHGGVCAAGAGRELLLWRPGKVAKPDELEALIGDGFDLAKRFSRARG